MADTADETGSTFEANATIKAMHYGRLSGMPTLADDSGIEVDAMDGRPGVMTRRYAGPECDRRAEQHQAAGRAGRARRRTEQRTGRYQCVLVLAEPGEDGEPRVVETARGTFEGRIALESRGDGGFGYDPIFEPYFEPIGGRTVGELTRRGEERGVAPRRRARCARAARPRLLGPRR